MFNYIGVIDKRIFDIDREAYDVRIEAISPEPVQALVLTTPGMFTRFVPGDVVVVGEIEGDSDFDFIILGIIQHKFADSLDVKHTFTRAQFDELDMNGNTIDARLEELEKEVNVLKALRSILP